MAAVTAVRLRRWRVNSAPRFAVLLTALAFLLQCLVTQMHIHGAPLGDAVKVSAIQSQAPGKAPADDHSQRDCPFCQAIAHAGAFLTPTASPLVLSTAATCAAVFLTVRSAAVSAAHSWQSRAPPSR